MRAAPDRAGVGFELAEDQLDQRRFAGAIGPNQAEPVAALNPHRQVTDEDPFTKSLVDVLDFSHQLAGAFTRIHRQLHITDLFAARSAFDPQ